MIEPRDVGEAISWWVVVASLVHELGGRVLVGPRRAMCPELARGVLRRSADDSMMRAVEAASAVRYSRSKS